MPIRVNLKEIFPSDPQEITVDKVNFNFNKLLELGIGTPGPIGLTGPQGPAGPIGLTGPQGDRGATWWVDSGDPNTLTFTGLIDGDLYLDQDSNAFQVYQYDDATGTWTPIVSIAAIVNSYLSSLSTIPFEAVPTTQNPGTTTVNKFILFDERAFGSDSVRGINNTSQNNILFLNNFDETSIGVLPEQTLGQNQYNSLFAIFPDHSDSQTSSNAEIGRYHIELGSLYMDDDALPIGTIKYSNIKHNLKAKFYKKYISTAQLSSTNSWINVAKFSLSFTENQTFSDIDQNAEFEFLLPKWNNEGMSPIREQLTIRLSSAEAAVEQGSAFTHIVADGIHMAIDPSPTNPFNLNASIGLALDFSSANVKLSGKTHLMLDANSGVNGVILLNKNTVINGELDVAGPIITSGNSGLPSSVGSSPILAGNFGTPNIGRLYIGDGTGWNFHFSSRASSINTDLVTFQDNGSVGIGISIPTAKVHINNTTFSDSFRVDDAASPDTSPFIITNIGRVGIGTDSPTTKLHIDGTFRLNSSPVADSFLRGDSSGNGTWSAITNIGVPVGAVMPYFGNTAPTGWLLCDGTIVLQSVFPALYAHLVANGMTSFPAFPPFIPSPYTETPSLVDKFIVGAGSSYALKATGGANNVSLTKAQLPKHKHVLDDTIDGAVFNDSGNHQHFFRSAGDRGPGGGGREPYSWNDGASSVHNVSPDGNHKHTGNTGDGTSDDVGLGGTGGNGAPHENRPPFYALTYIIKT
jgi:microcystin-dependent protein